MLIKIPLTLIELKFQKDIDLKEAFLELGYNFLRCKHIFIANEPKNIENPELGWEMTKNFCEVYIDKNHIDMIEKMLHADGDKWGVEIMTIGNHTYKAWFKSEKESTQVFNALINWKYDLLLETIYSEPK